MLYFIAKYAQGSKFLTVTLQVLYNEINHYHIKHESTNSVCRQCESNTEFKGNKQTHLTPLFYMIYTNIEFENRAIPVKTARCHLDFNTSSTSKTSKFTASRSPPCDSMASCLYIIIIMITCARCHPGARKVHF